MEGGLAGVRGCEEEKPCRSGSFCGWPIAPSRRPLPLASFLHFMHEKESLFCSIFTPVLLSHYGTQISWVSFSCSFSLPLLLRVAMVGQQSMCLFAQPLARQFQNGQTKSKKITFEAVDSAEAEIHFLARSRLLPPPQSQARLR